MRELHSGPHVGCDRRGSLRSDDDDDDNINIPPGQGLQEHDLHLLDRRDQTHLTTDDTTDKGKARVSGHTTHKYTHMYTSR